MEATTEAVPPLNAASSADDKEGVVEVKTVEEGDAKDEEKTKDEEGTKNADQAVFGSLSSTIADALCDSVEAALLKGVASLPLLSSSSEEGEEGEEPSALLMEQLRKKYWRNVDLFELYCRRNIFSLRMYPPKRRQLIVERLLTNSSSSEASAVLDDVTVGKMNETVTVMPEPAAADDVPTKDQIPSNEQMEAMEKELEELRERLKVAKRRRSAAKKAIKELDALERVVAAAEKPLQDVDPAAVQQEVTAAVKGAEGLEELQHAGEELATKLEEVKRGRDPAEDDDDEVIDLQAQKKTQKMTLQEKYERDSQGLTTTDIATLERVKQMITWKK
jgi:hypothetical protein